MSRLLGETRCCNDLRLSDVSDHSTATGASSLEPLDVESNEAALPVALFFKVLAVEMSYADLCG